MKTIRFSVVAALLLSACAHERYLRTELYFGTSRGADRSPVASAEWDRFVAEEIAPRFPEGFTQLPARGQWKSESEESHLIVIVRERDDDAKARKLEELRALYKERFQQSSVLRVDQSASAAF